jgi:hypothetical protein
MEPHMLGVGMDEHPATLGVQVAVGPGGDADEVATATLQLRGELLDLDVDAVELPGRASRRRDPARWTWWRCGTLVVHVADSQLLAAAVAAVRSRLVGSSWRSIKLELSSDALELTGWPRTPGD